MASNKVLLYSLLNRLKVGHGGWGGGGGAVQLPGQTPLVDRHTPVSCMQASPVPSHWRPTARLPSPPYACAAHCMLACAARRARARSHITGARAGCEGEGRLCCVACCAAGVLRLEPVPGAGADGPAPPRGGGRGLRPAQRTGGQARTTGGRGCLERAGGGGSSHANHDAACESPSPAPCQLPSCPGCLHALPSTAAPGCPTPHPSRHPTPPRAHVPLQAGSRQQRCGHGGHEGVPAAHPGHDHDTPAGVCVWGGVCRSAMPCPAPRSCHCLVCTPPVRAGSSGAAPPPSSPPPLP